MKIKIFRISFALFKQLFTDGRHSLEYTVLSGAIPEDAEIVNAHTSWNFPGMIELQIKSEQFDEVASGEPIPELITTMRNELVNLSVDARSLVGAAIKRIPAEEVIA